MKFEHHKQKVISVRKFAIRILKYFLVSVSLIAVSLFIGIAGYAHFGHLNFVDSLHMSSMILTGMGPVAEMKTDAGKIFSSAYALYSGVIFLSIAAVLFAPIIHRILHILNVED
jgi:hypothetical protein